MRQTLSIRRSIERVAVALAVLASMAGIIAIESHPAAASKPAATAGAQQTTVTQQQAIVNAAASQAGVPYCEGGGGINGPTVGNASSTCASGVKGYDCMSLAQYAVYQGTGITVPQPPDANLPGSGTFVPPNANNSGDDSAVQPGDVVFFGGSSLDDYSHSGIYAGNNEVWDALQPGEVVEEHTFATLYSDYGNVYRGAVQYWTSGSAPAPLAITTTSLPAGTKGVAYSATLKASGGTTPYAWTRTSGTLPSGLKLNRKTGVISGTPTKAATHTFKVKVKDTKTKTQAATTATTSLSVTVNT